MTQRLPLITLLLLFLAPGPAGRAAAQSVTVTPRGTDATLDVATWNVEWFGSASLGPSNDARQRANVRAVVEQAGIDLWALQEIDDPADFTLLLQELGDGFDGVLGQNASGSVTQRVGFLYRKDVVAVRGVEQLLTPDYDQAFAYRPPLKLDATITLPDTTLALSFITVHMKADADPGSHDRRREAALRLKNRIDFLYPNTPIILLGDFNDELGGSITSGRASPYQNFLDDAAYRFLTLPLDEQNIPTWCGNSSGCTSGSTLDHILITDELMPAYVEGSAGRYEELLHEVQGFTATTSDHLPVLARFAFAAATAVAPDGVPGPLALHAAYPNPFHDATTLRYTLDRALPVRLEIYDLLGRRVAVPAEGFRAAGSYEAVFQAADLPEGIYLARFQAGTYSTVQRLVLLR